MKTDIHEGADPRNTEFARDVFAWYKQIHTDRADIPNAKPISAFDFRLAYAISQYVDKFSRKAWPFQSTLAQELGVTDRTVRAGLANLVKHGHLSVTLRGRDQSAVYQMIIQDRKLISGHDHSRPEADFRSKPQDRKSSAARPEKSRRKTGSTLPTEPLFEPQREPLRGEDSLQPLFDLEEDGRRSQQKTPAPDSTDADFEEWWQQTPRKVGKVSAAKLYRRIVQKGDATVEELTAGILRYAAEVENREERYIAHPSTWLSQGRWADEPAKPAGITIDSYGNEIIQPAPDQRRTTTPSWTAIATKRVQP